MKNYYFHGKPHRKDGPCEIHYEDDTRVCFYKYKGVNYRYDDPEKPTTVEIYNDGKIKYEAYYNPLGYLHRDPKKGPAVINYNEDGDISSCYYEYNGYQHRPEDEGPSCIKFYDDDNDEVPTSFIS